MKKWKYRFESANRMDPGTAVTRLDKLGSEGWELVSSFIEGEDPNFILKREIAAPRKKK